MGCGKLRKNEGGINSIPLSLFPPPSPASSIYNKKCNLLVF